MKKILYITIVIIPVLLLLSACTPYVDRSIEGKDEVQILTKYYERSYYERKYKVTIYSQDTGKTFKLNVTKDKYNKLVLGEWLTLDELKGKR